MFNININKFNLNKDNINLDEGDRKKNQNQIY